MTSITAFARGFRQSVRCWRLTLYGWLASFLFSLLGVLPAYFFLQGNYGRSTLWQAMRNQFSWLWLGDAIHRHGDLLPLLSGGLITLLAGWLLLSMFLNGGLVGRLQKPAERVTLASFFGDCGANFGRFFRLFLFSLPLYLLAILLASLLGFAIGQLNPTPLTEWGHLWQAWVRLGLLAVAIATVNMVGDFAKIGLARREDRKAWRALRETLRWLAGRKFFSAVGVYLLAAVVAGFISLAYLEVVRFVPASFGWVVIVLLPLQQLLVAARQWNRTLFIAAETELYTDLPLPCAAGDGNPGEAKGSDLL